MEPTPQQVEEDVFVGSRQIPPSKLKMPSCRDGLLKDLVVLGNVPIAEVVIRDMGLVHQDRRHQLPKGLVSRTGIFHVLFTFYFIALTLVVIVQSLAQT